jgi:Type II restriction endonuclease EcoO109I
MNKLNLDDVTRYVEENIGVFHQKRIESLDRLKLSQVLKRKNPYLFKAKYVLTASELVKGIVDAHISSSEEGIFGEWLEGLAIFINEKVYNGKKSSAKGVDLEFDKDNKRYIVSIKSGPNWGNSSQIVKMVTDFKSAKKTLRTSGSALEIVAVNGCCYGVDNQPDKGDYFKYCGQQFWAFISGDSDLFVKIIEPLGHKAQKRNEDFMASYAKKLNKFTLDFANEFCTPDGALDWESFVRFNSQIKKQTPDT